MCLHKAVLPKLPAIFGNEAAVGKAWQMLGNDEYSDCVWAGAAHETMLQGRGAATWYGSPRRACWATMLPSPASNPGDPSTDNGTVMQAAARGIAARLASRTRAANPTFHK